MSTVRGSAARSAAAMASRSGLPLSPMDTFDATLSAVAGGSHTSTSATSIFMNVTS